MIGRYELWDRYARLAIIAASLTAVVTLAIVLGEPGGRVGFSSVDGFSVEGQILELRITNHEGHRTRDLVEAYEIDAEKSFEFVELTPVVASGDSVWVSVDLGADLEPDSICVRILPLGSPAIIESCGGQET